MTSERFVAIVAWDGLLPLVVASSTLVAVHLLPEPLAALAAIFIPLGAAGIRASTAQEELMRRCDGRAPLLRQLALAGAIVLLFLGELLVGVLSLIPAVPVAGWCAPVALYAAYLAFIAWALRPYESRAAVASFDDGATPGRSERPFEARR